MAIDFTKVPQKGHETYTFFAASMSAALRGLLTEQGVDGFEILPAAKAKAKYGAVPNGPVRLTDASPREERSVACLVSRFDPDAMAAAIRLLPGDEAYLNWAGRASNDTIDRMARAGDWDFQNAGN